ncbi:hypothetical protein V2J09_016375 [Rumex salicifolius]
MGDSDAIARKETPPDDDVCPVCFGDFVVPCRADCGHWFCGSCILQVWNFSSALQACNCPMCSRLIKSLKPHASLLNPVEEEDRKLFTSIQRYNRLFVGGVQGFVQIPIKFTGIFMHGDFWQLSHRSSIYLLSVFILFLCSFFPRKF